MKGFTLQQLLPFFFAMIVFGAWVVDAASQQGECQAELLLESAPAVCFTLGECSGGADCCFHFHNALNWHSVFDAGLKTDSRYAGKVKRFYVATNSGCQSENCIQGGTAQCGHFELDRTLATCLPPE